MTQAFLEEKFVRAAQVVCRQGMVQFPVTDTAIAIIKSVVGDCEEELDLIYAFNRSASQTAAQLKESSGLAEEKIDDLAIRLAKKGLIFNQPNSAGIMVYRLLPLMLVGLMEYKFMVPLAGSQEEKTLARLFEKLLEELREQVQDRYEELLPLFRIAPAADRTVAVESPTDGKGTRTIPVHRSVEVSDEFILPSQTVEEIIAKFDDIAVGYCFCRQRRNLLGDSCTLHAPTMNCFSFGKSARHTVAQGFARKVSREEALKIMKEAEEAGLIHKAFHPGSRETSPETSICNCCKDCCDTLRLWRSGTMPLVNSTYHLSVIDQQACSGCGTCVERCPTDAIDLDDQGLARRDENACIGCGICARFCPEKAISLKEGLRRVCIPPPRLAEKRKENVEA